MYDQNPFSEQNSDHRAIWDILIRNEIEAGWNQNINFTDYDENAFEITDARGQIEPDAWVLNTPDLKTYTERRLRQYAELKEGSTEPDLRLALYRESALRNVQILADKASAYQTRGTLEGIAETEARFLRLRKIAGKWKIQSLIENCAFAPRTKSRSLGKILPEGAVQHKTAGPYSPALRIRAEEFVVISGQAPIDMEGVVHGDTIEEQTRFTMENCRKQLNVAGVDFEQVFKVNVFLTDLDLWPRFNQVYQEIMPRPFPVRTAVATGLLYNFLVEIEMWATSKPR